MKRRNFLKGLFGTAFVGSVIAKELLNNPPELKKVSPIVEEEDYSPIKGTGVWNKTGRSSIVSKKNISSWDKKMREELTKETAFVLGKGSWDTVVIKNTLKFETGYRF